MVRRRFFVCKCRMPVLLLALVLAFCPALFAQAGGYLITTVAGLGSQGFSGDGGPALYAGLQYPTSVAVDNSGNLFIADNSNFRVRKVTPQGTISTVAGNGTQGFSGDGGPATSAQLDGMMELGVAADASGNLFIADRGNCRIRKVTPQGTITTVAGNGTPGSSGDGGPATSAQLYYPFEVAVNASGNLFIANSPGSGSNRIRKVTPQGTITTTSITNGGFAVDASGNFFVVGNDQILKVTPQGSIATVAGSGVPGFYGDGGAAVSARLSGPSGVAIDAAGNLFIADSLNNRIRKVTPQGIITTVAGSGAWLASGARFSGDGGPATSAALWNPLGVAVDASGNVFIADTGSNEIGKLVPTSASTAGCVYSIGPVDQSAYSFGAAGGAASVNERPSGASCPWLAISHADWITVSSSAVASGTGAATYTVSPNPDSASRAGTVWIAGGSLTVIQSGVVCSLGVAPQSVSAAASGLTGARLTVTSDAPDCQWTAVANVPWVLVGGGNTGAGTGTVTYTVGANTGGLRTGTITAAGQKVYVNQAASGGAVSSLASLNVGGIVNAASGSPPIAPGSFVSIYGQNLADTATDWSSAIVNGKLPTSLGGVQVLVNGKNALITYVQPTQVNVLTPADTAVGPVEVDVITNHGTVVAIGTMAAVSPALFTYALQSRFYADALFATDYAYVAAVGALPGVPSRPAKSGDYILLFATGLGQTNPPYPVGQVLTAAYPVPDLSRVSVLIAGQPALVQFAGMTYAGLFQINIQVPNGIPAGDQPIVLEVSGQASLSTVYLTFGGG
jgi:uncharacterized protein (TIGR03437 family)